MTLDAVDKCLTHFPGYLAVAERPECATTCETILEGEVLMQYVCPMSLAMNKSIYVYVC